MSMMHSVAQILSVEQIGDYAQVDITKMKPKDPRAPTRSDLLKIERELIEGLEKVPTCNGDWSDMGLGVVVASVEEWNRRENNRLENEYSKDINNWEEKKETDKEIAEALDNPDWNLNIWISDNKKPKLGTRNPLPKPPKNPGRFKALTTDSKETNEMKFYNHRQDTMDFYAYESANAYAVKLIKDRSVLGTDIFSSMSGDGKQASARELLQHVRSRFNKVTPTEIVTAYQEFWKQPDPRQTLTEYLARQQKIVKGILGTEVPITKEIRLIAALGHMFLREDHQKDLIKWTKENFYGSRKKSFNEFVTWMSKKDDELHQRKNALKNNGISTAAQAMNERMETLVKQNEEATAQNTQLKNTLEIATDRLLENKTVN